MIENITNFTFNHSDQPDDLYKIMTAAEVKQAFDSRGNELKDKVNEVITQSNTNETEISKRTLSADFETHKTSGDHDSRYSLKSNTYTKTETNNLVFGVTLGQIPNDSLTEQKMANDMKKDIVGGVTSYNEYKTFKDNITSSLSEIETKAGKVGTKEVDETNIQDNYTLRYDGEKDKLVYVRSEIDRTPPNPATNFTAEKGNAKVTLTWTNPVNEDFAGVKIIRKEDSYPTSVTDGTVVYTGANTSYTDNTVVNDTTYYYRIFTYDTSNNYNTIEEGQEATATPKGYVIYGVKIDTTNSNPSSALTYIDMAVGFVPASGNNGNFQYGSWQDKFPFNQIKPCLYKNGTVNYYLNPNDYAKKLDETSADITSGNDGDVMVEFPKVYWKFETIGTDLYIRYSDGKVDDNYKCLAHMRGTIEKDKCYISSYLGYSLSSKLRSLSGKTPTANQTIGAFRTQAQANGSGYDQMAYYQLLMLQVLFIVMFKSRDSQTALGRGYVDENDDATTTGQANTKGLFYGETTGKYQNKFCGIEDFWGNCYYWIDGLYSDSNRNMLIGTQNFNDTGSGYTSYGQGATDNINGYISDIQGTTETGFLVKATAGSETTYYSDYGYLHADCLLHFGGIWLGDSNAGAFRLDVHYSASYTTVTIGGRLLAL